MGFLNHQQDGQASPEPSAFPAAEKPTKQAIKRWWKLWKLGSGGS